MGTRRRRNLRHLSSHVNLAVCLEEHTLLYSTRAREAPRPTRCIPAINYRRCADQGWRQATAMYRLSPPPFFTHAVEKTRLLTKITILSTKSATLPQYMCRQTATSRKRCQHQLLQRHNLIRRKSGSAAQGWAGGARAGGIRLSACAVFSAYLAFLRTTPARPHVMHLTIVGRAKASTWLRCDISVESRTTRGRCRGAGKTIRGRGHAKEMNHGERYGRGERCIFVAGTQAEKEGVLVQTGRAHQ